jgi:hypothetical protein
MSWRVRIHFALAFLSRLQVCMFNPCNHPGAIGVADSNASWYFRTGSVKQSQQPQLITKVASNGMQGKSDNYLSWHPVHRSYCVRCMAIKRYTRTVTAVRRCCALVLGLQRSPPVRHLCLRLSCALSACPGRATCVETCNDLRCSSFRHHRSHVHASLMHGHHCSRLFDYPCWQITASGTFTVSWSHMTLAF